MNELPLFSLLMANYNNAKYIDYAIDTVLKQTYQNWELIIVDDCSTDNSKEIYKNYEANKRIKIFFNEANRGYGFTVDRCARLATGSICGILDPDDALASNQSIEIMVEAYANNPDSGMICSRHVICNATMKPLWDSPIRDKDPSIIYLTDREHFPEHFITFSTAVYLNKCAIDPTYRNAVDQEFYYRMEEVSKITFIDAILYAYRYIDSGISHHGYKALYWHAKAIMEACTRRGIDPEPVVEKLFAQVVKPHKEAKEKLLNSDYYRLGYKILYPLKKLKRKFLK